MEESIMLYNTIKVYIKFFRQLLLIITSSVFIVIFSFLQSLLWFKISRLYEICLTGIG